MILSASAPAPSTGPAIAAKTGAGHFVTTAPAAAAAPITASPLAPPAAAEPVGPSTSSSTNWLLIGGIAAALGVGGYFLMRKK